MAIRQTKNEIICKSGRSEESEVEKSLRQEDPMSTTLCNLILEGIIRRSMIKTGETDDLAILTKPPKRIPKYREKNN